MAFKRSPQTNESASLGKIALGFSVSAFTVPFMQFGGCFLDAYEHINSPRPITKLISILDIGKALLMIPFSPFVVGYDGIVGAKMTAESQDIWAYPKETFKENFKDYSSKEIKSIPHAKIDALVAGAISSPSLPSTPKSTSNTNINRMAGQGSFKSPISQPKKSSGFFSNCLAKLAKPFNSIPTFKL